MKLGLPIQSFGEAAQFLDITLDDLAKVAEEVDVNKEWKAARSNVAKFYNGTNYYLFDLLQWEVSGGKRAMQLEIIRFLREFGLRNVLDYGCGIGSDAIAIIEAIPEVKMTIADLASKHFDFAKWRLRKRNHAVAYHTLNREEATQLPANDLTICIAVMEHLKDPHKALRKIKDSAKFVALRCDPTPEQGPFHLVDNNEFLLKLENGDRDLLKELGLVRVNGDTPQIFRILR